MYSSALGYFSIRFTKFLRINDVSMFDAIKKKKKKEKNTYLKFYKKERQCISLNQIAQHIVS